MWYLPGIHQRPVNRSLYSLMQYILQAVVWHATACSACIQLNFHYGSVSRIKCQWHHELAFTWLLNYCFSMVDSEHRIIWVIKIAFIMYCSLVYFLVLALTRNGIGFLFGLACHHKVILPTTFVTCLPICWTFIFVLHMTHSTKFAPNNLIWFLAWFSMWPSLPARFAALFGSWLVCFLILWTILELSKPVAPWIWSSCTLGNSMAFKASIHLFKSGTWPFSQQLVPGTRISGPNDQLIP